MTLTLIVLLPFLGSLCAAVLPSNARNAESWLAGLVTVTCTVLVVSLYPQVMDGGVVRARLPWLPQLGLEFYLRMDGYAWLFALLVAFMGALVVLYARYYMSPAGSGAALLLVPAWRSWARCSASCCRAT